MDSNFILKFEPQADFRLLYLARHVKENPVNSAKRFGQYPRYHREVLGVLQTLVGDVSIADDESFLEQKITNADYIFSLMNRVPMRNGEVYVSALCEFVGRAYLGSNPSVRAVAEDKHLAKHLASSLGVDTAPWIVASQSLKMPSTEPFAGPFFVKPRNGAGSEHIDEQSFAVTWTDASLRASQLIDIGLEAIIEQFVPGENITIPVIGGFPSDILPAVLLETQRKSSIITHGDKLQTTNIMPFSILDDLSVQKKLSETSSKIFSAIAPTDYARMDFRYDKKSGRLAFLEMNICCDISSFGSLMFSANSLGISQRDLISHILCYSHFRQKRPG
ncbi:hypothetical protein [Thalassospira sp. GB04J01]|uniref:hypothetical protein n=1 Tax=Thalassospira sp. GB04J01 TaxID=1485225 RepID=UPI000C9AC8A5|nr:hypothetical protein [Thalassospira sp. GB04J01]|tara:strand:+ start:9521 stop:10519 length:999 start_codon:yes stop_codon:yes gene_type:complete